MVRSLRVYHSETEEQLFDRRLHVVVRTSRSGADQAGADSVGGEEKAEDDSSGRPASPDHTALPVLSTRTRLEFRTTRIQGFVAVEIDARTGRTSAWLNGGEHGRMENTNPPDASTDHHDKDDCMPPDTGDAVDDSEAIETGATDTAAQAEAERRLPILKAKDVASAMDHRHETAPSVARPPDPIRTGLEEDEEEQVSMYHAPAASARAGRLGRATTTTVVQRMEAPHATNQELIGQDDTLLRRLVQLCNWQYVYR